jgi:hypothetical protein
MYIWMRRRHAAKWNVAPPISGLSNRCIFVDSGFAAHRIASLRAALRPGAARHAVLGALAS